MPIITRSNFMGVAENWSPRNFLFFGSTNARLDKIFVRGSSDFIQGMPIFGNISYIGLPVAN